MDRNIAKLARKVYTVGLLEDVQEKNPTKYEIVIHLKEYKYIELYIYISNLY